MLFLRDRYTKADFFLERKVSFDVVAAPAFQYSKEAVTEFFKNKNLTLLFLYFADYFLSKVKPSVHDKVPEMKRRAEKALKDRGIQLNEFSRKLGENSNS